MQNPRGTTLHARRGTAPATPPAWPRPHKQEQQPVEGSGGKADHAGIGMAQLVRATSRASTRPSAPACRWREAGASRSSAMLGGSCCAFAGDRSFTSPDNLANRIWASVLDLLVNAEKAEVRKKLRRARQPANPPPLSYLHNEDEELGSAIRNNVWRSAWGKWYTAQSLANSARRRRRDLRRRARPCGTLQPSRRPSSARI